jgi:molybdopterin converting factor subunit 1
MEITVRLFATLRQEAGWSVKRVRLPEGSTLGMLLEMLGSTEDGVKVADRPVYAAVNSEYARSEQVLYEGDVVALFPPVSGGGELR